MIPPKSANKPKILLLAILVSIATLSAGANPTTKPESVASSVNKGLASELSAGGSSLEGYPESKLPPARAEIAGQMRVEAVSEAKLGHFAGALAKLREAAGISPNSDAEDAVGLLAQYVSARRRSDLERQAEYAKAVQRVRMCLLAEDYLPQLRQAGLLPEAKDDDDTSADVPTTHPGEDSGPTYLSMGVSDIGDAYERIAGAEKLDSSLPEQAAGLKKESLKAIDEASTALAKTVRLVAGRSDEYSGAFSRLAENLQAQLMISEKAWLQLDPNDEKARSLGSVKLADVHDDLRSALGDLEMLVAKKPWRVGLAQAGLAAMLAPDGTEMDQRDWYTAVKTIAEDKGIKAMEDARWYDALSAYRGLSDLEEDNEQYDAKLKTARRHVRMLALYGNDDGAGESESDTQEQKLSWTDVVAGADAKIVRNAISEIGSYYVTDVDYKKLAFGGLNAIRVLAETPQAARSFPELRDRGQLGDFLQSIEREKRAIDEDDRVDAIDVLTALNATLWASLRTVKIPVEVLSVEFAEGMVDELDMFSAIIWPNDAADFIKQTSGKFYGVGVQITKEPGKPLQVVTPLADTPAFRMGIKSGDTILAVNGQRTDFISIDKLIRMITGEKGTRVVLTIEREGLAKPKDFSIIRQEIRIKTVKGWRRLPGGDWDHIVDPEHNIGYLRVTQFTDQTPTDITKALTDLRSDGVRSVIMDLRHNPGGLLQSATRTADQFLSTGRVVSTKVRSTPVAEFNAHPEGEYLEGDLVVLVNRYSASAAEIVSGAIKDWGRGLIIGERTYGKGSVQHVITIKKEKAYLKLTAAHYYLPSGRLLHKTNGSKDWGVDPDVKVQLTPKQAKRWLDLRRKTDLLQDIDPDRLASDLSKQYEADLPLSTAVVLLRLMQLQPRSSASRVAA